jgi:hypothetical protein
MKDIKSKKSPAKIDDKNRDIRSMFNKNSKISQDIIQMEKKSSEFKEKQEEKIIKIKKNLQENKSKRKFSEM